MPKEMLINVSEGEECRIALLQDGKLDELYMERTSSTSHVGNIYKGRVTNVEPSIQAAFVDFGLGRNGFLHISDLMPAYFGRKGEDIQESVGKKMARRDRPPIQRCLRRGDEIIVQIIKEGIGTKGPTLSTYLSIPGRILVMMPGMGKMGVSKKIEDDEERRRLRQILDSLKPPKGVGFIIRTAGIGKTKAEIQRDLTYLSRLWMQIEKKRTSGPGAMELYTEGDLVARTVRDVFTSDVDRIVIDNKEVAKRVREVIKITSPRTTKDKLEVYEEPIPLFHKYGIEKDIELMYSRHVPLPSGGSLVIDSTEAIVAIDVNSGKFRDHSDAEMTAFKTDMEAAEEIPRQLKLRDLGGVIICDFIDLRYERHRRELEEKLHENFKKDRAKTKVLRMSQFGIIEITRQRMRPSLKRSIYFDCPHCKGAGLVKTPESMSLDVMRKLAIAAHNDKVARLEMAVCPDVGFYLLNKKRAALSQLEGESRKKIFVRTEPSLGLDEIKLTLFDGRDGMIVLDELGMTPQPPHTSQLNTRPAGQKGRHDRGRGGRGRGRGGQQPPPRHEEDLELDEAEDAIEEREVRRERTPADDALAASIAPKIVHPPDADEDVDEPQGAVQDEASQEVEAEPIEGEEEEEQNVVDVDDGPSTLGERPQGEWDRPGDDRHRRGRRGGRGGRGGDRDRGGSDRGQQQQRGGGQDQRPQGDQRPPRDQRPQGDQRPPRDQRPQGDQRPPRDQRPQGDQRPPRDQRGGQQPRHFQQRDQRGGQQRGGQQRGGQQRPYRNQRPQRDNRQRDYYRDQQANQANMPPVPENLHELDDETASIGPGNEKPPGEAIPPTAGTGQGYGGPGQGYGQEGEGKRRRRRRGGKRHRRRRERERMEREQRIAQGLPVDDDVNGDYDGAGSVHEQQQPDVRDDRSAGEDQHEEPPPRDEVEAREPEPRAEREPAPEASAHAEAEEAPPAKKKRGGRKPASSSTTSRGRSKRSSSKSSAKSEPSGSAKPQAAEPPVVKTGSADKHLADDEPVDPQPAPRPRKRYDLDEIADDYD